MDERRRERWEKLAEWPLTAAALVFLVGYAWPILNPDIPPVWLQVCVVTSWSAWVMFAVDYAVRFGFSRRRKVFVRSNLLDLAVVVLPLLRPLRLLRLVTLLTVLNRNASTSLRGRVAVYVGGASVAVMFVASLAMLNSERGVEGANITTFGDAVWWAMTTVTTVGYGDEYPVTAQGRFIAAGLMIAGIALLGVVTATLASWLVERVEQVEAEAQAATRRDVEVLAREVAELRRALEQRESTHGSPVHG